MSCHLAFLGRGFDSHHLHHRKWGPKWAPFSMVKGRAWESKSLNCWQVAAPGDSPGGCRRGSAACQQFARPERQAAGLMRRDSHHRGCHRALIPGHQDQRRISGVPASDSSLRSASLRGRHRLRRCGPLLPSLRCGQMVARLKRQAEGLMRRDSHHRTGGACPPGAIRPSTW